jgi:hypothetical protein
MYLFSREFVHGLRLRRRDGTLEVQTQWVRNKISYFSSPSTPKS